MEKNPCGRKKKQLRIAISYCTVKESRQGLPEGLYGALALTVYQQVREMLFSTPASGSAQL